MKIPILTLKETLDSLLEWISTNYTHYNNLTTPEESWLYDTFNENMHGNFNFYTQLVSIMTRTSKHSRKLETRLMFDNTRANLPTIHIHMPGEAKGGFTSLNAQTGGVDLGADNAFTQNLARSSTSTYELIITGSNSEEVIAIYEMLQTIFIAGHDTLQNNFETFEYAGAELMANPELIPYNTFFRAFRITIGSERIVKSIVAFPTIESVGFIGLAADPEGSSVEVSTDSIILPLISGVEFIGEVSVGRDGGIIYIPFTVESSIEITLNPTVVNDGWSMIRFIGDGTHTITFSDDFVEGATSTPFDSGVGKINWLIFYSDGGTIIYSNTVLN